MVLLRLECTMGYNCTNAGTCEGLLKSGQEEQVAEGTFIRKRVVFCESYGTIRSTLYFATHKADSYPVTIAIPGHHDLYKLFKAFNEEVFNNSLAVIYLEPYYSKKQKPKGMRKLFYVISKIFEEKLYLREMYNTHFCELENRDIFFSSRYYNGPLFYMLRKLGKKNRLIYLNTSSPDRTPSKEYIPTNVLDVTRLILNKIIYGLGMTMCRFPNAQGIPYIPDKFVRRAGNKVIGRDEVNQLVRVVDLSKFNIFEVGNYSVMYFDQDLLAIGCFTSSLAYWKALNDILEILSRYFPEREIGIKYHPNSRCDKSKIKVGNILPDFIPAEFLYSEKTRVYLSFSSTALANVKKGLCISILNLVPFKSEKEREAYKDLLKQVSQSEILFPKSLDEFEKILADGRPG